MHHKHVLVTGANGFVGQAVVRGLAARGEYLPLAGVRSLSENTDTDDIRTMVLGDLAQTELSAELFRDVSVVVHCAARAHVMREFKADPLAAYRATNVTGTLRLGRQAAEAGVRRFIFLSSIKVNGESTALGKPFQANDRPSPKDAYALSKSEAESGLLQLAAETKMEVVIIRPTLVYGPGVKGNFASMIRLLQKGLPLPLGAVHNKRSLVGLDNLVDLIIRCIDHPSAANQIFLAADGQDLSTSELLQAVGMAMGKPARLLPVPEGWLRFGATLLGKRAVAQRLLGSLQVDIARTCEHLNWKPPYTVEEGLRRCFAELMTNERMYP